MTTISTLPPAPQPTDDTATFNSKAFALLAALATFVSETNTVAGEANTAAGNAATNASNAATQAAAALASQLAAALSANAAAGSAGATAWNASTAYSVGQRVWSLINAQLYRRIAAGTTATDPYLDQTNWARVYVEAEMVTAESFFL